MSEFDHIFRDSLNNYGSELPQGMWEKIESQLSPPSKKRDVLGYLLFGILMLISAYVSTLNTNRSTSINENQASELGESSQYREDPLPSVLPLDIKNNNEKSTVDEKIVTKENQRSEKVELSNIDNKNNINLSNKNTLHSAKSKLKKQVPLASYLSESEESSTKDFESTSESSVSRKILSLNTISGINLTALEAEERIFKDPIGCPSFSGRPTPNIFIESYFNSFYGMQLLSSNSPEIGQQYLDARRSTENPLYSWSAGVNVGWISSKNIGVKTGALYELINERFVFEDSMAIGNQTIITIDTIFNPDGSFIVNSDTSIVDVLGYESLSIYNYHRSIEIPIHILYQFRWNDLFVELSGGPNFNIQYSNRGKILDPSNEDRWFTNGPDGDYKVFKDKLSWSLSLNVSLLYSLNENIQLYLRPNFKFHPNTWSVNSSPFNQRYANYGVALGARYYLNGNPNY